MASPRPLTGTGLLGPVDAEKASLGLTTASANVALPGSTYAFEITVDADAYVEFGGPSVTATTSSRFFPAGAAHYKVVEGVSHVAGILASGTANLTISRLE